MFFNLLFSKFYIKDKKENKNRKQQFFLIFLIQTIEYKKYFYNKSINKIKKTRRVTHFSLICALYLSLSSDEYLYLVEMFWFIP